MGDCHSFDPGSNPGPGVQSSLQIPTEKASKKIGNKRLYTETTEINIGNDIHNISKKSCELRDIYNRKQRLKYCIGRINADFSGRDKIDLLKFLEIMQEKDQSKVTIIRSISVMS